jgi:hypothetical protein
MPAGKGKRVPLNMRTTQELRARVAKAAADSGRSLVQEVEARLEQSFLEEDAASRAFGGRDTAVFLRWLGAAAELTETLTGKEWLRDWGTFLAVRGAWNGLIARAVPPEPKDWEESLEEAKAYFPIPELPDLPSEPLPEHGPEGLAAFERAMAEWKAESEKQELWMKEAEEKFAKAREDFERFIDTPKHAAEVGRKVVASVKRDMPGTRDKR